MCSVTTFMSFFRILKLRTSPSCWSGTCNYSTLLLNSSFIAVHSSDSFTLSFFLSFFLFSSCSAMARNCLGRQTTRVLFRPYLDIDVSTVCSTGLSLISPKSLDDVDNVSEPTILSSSSLSEPKVVALQQSSFSYWYCCSVLLEMLILSPRNLTLRKYTLNYCFRNWTLSSGSPFY